MDDDDSILCETCHCTEPNGLASGTVFWMNYDKSGERVALFVFQKKKKNAVTRKQANCRIAPHSFRPCAVWHTTSARQTMCCVAYY